MLPVFQATERASEALGPSVRGVRLRQRFTQWLKRGKPGVLVKPGWEGESKMAVQSNVLRYLFWQTGMAAGPSIRLPESLGTDSQ